MDTEGSFLCACNEGFTGDGFNCTGIVQDPSNLTPMYSFILDIDECSTGMNNCSSNATCDNTQGGFNCSCNSGYQGDGITCQSKIE